jgi:hypothetical protein
MKVLKRVFILLVFYNAVSFCGADSLSLGNIQGDFDAYADSIMHSLPLNAAFGSDWSDAYIGNLPYHFGIGLSIGGLTTTGEPFIKEINNFAGNTAAIAPISGYRTGIIPAYVLNFRIGGYFLPFDIGGKIGYLWAGLKSADSDNSRYFILTGVDLRFALLKGSATMPKISLGAGFNYLNGGIELLLNDKTTFPVGAHTLSATGNPTLDFFWETKVLEFKVQISKTIGGPLLSPYLGLVGGLAWSQAGYQIKSALSYDGGDTTQADTDLKNLGIEGFNGGITNNGFSALKQAMSGFFRIYTGFSLNFSVLKADLSYSCIFPDSNYALALNLRLQR